MSKCSLYEKWRCATREARLRRKVFPKWIDEGKMSEEKARWQIECMEEIANDYYEQWQKTGGELPKQDENLAHLW